SGPLRTQSIAHTCNDLADIRLTKTDIESLKLLIESLQGGNSIHDTSEQVAMSAYIDIIDQKEPVARFLATSLLLHVGVAGALLEYGIVQKKFYLQMGTVNGGGFGSVAVIADHFGGGFDWRRLLPLRFEECLAGIPRKSIRSP